MLRKSIYHNDILSALEARRQHNANKAQLAWYENETNSNFTQATPATKTANSLKSATAQYDNPEARRAIRFSKYCASYELLFTRDDVKKWEHEITRTAQFKAYTAYTKPHSYLDEFIPF